jgi:hypothetical protein
MAHEDRIAVSSGTHCPDGANCTARASNILNDDLLPERLRHVLADDASCNVS